MPTMELKASIVLGECKEWLATNTRSFTTVCIIGSVEHVWNEEEKINIKDFLFKVIYEMTLDYEPLFISGECHKGGVDIWMKKICVDIGATYKGYPPLKHNWNGYKKRNRLMAEACDILIRVFNARSKTYGSGWTADRAEDLGKKVLRVKVW